MNNTLETFYLLYPLPKHDVCLQVEYSTDHANPFMRCTIEGFNINIGEETLKEAAEEAFKYSNPMNLTPTVENGQIVVTSKELSPSALNHSKLTDRSYSLLHSAKRMAEVLQKKSCLSEYTLDMHATGKEASPTTATLFMQKAYSTSDIVLTINTGKSNPDHAQATKYREKRALAIVRNIKRKYPENLENGVSKTKTENKSDAIALTISTTSEEHARIIFNELAAHLTQLQEASKENGYAAMIEAQRNPLFPAKTHQQIADLLQEHFPNTTDAQRKAARLALEQLKQQNKEKPRQRFE